MSKNSPEESQAVPFFARFLEGQDVEEISDEESEALSGGKTFQTKKYPSDQEDGGGGGIQTLKYPSDNEEGGGNVVTLKHPSDQEDVACVTNKPRFDQDNFFVTQKYPSDGDEEVAILK